MNGPHVSVWWVVAVLLGAGLVVGVVWCLRQISLRRAPVPGAFAIALAIHLLLGGGLFYVGLGDELARAVQKVQSYLPALDDYAASTRFEALEGYRAAPQPFELVKDLAAKDSVAPAEVPQTPLETPEMRVSAGGIAADVPVPRDDSPGQRADEMPEVPTTPQTNSPARTFVPTIETPDLPAAPLEAVPSLPAPTIPERRVAGAAVDVARTPSAVDPLAVEKPAQVTAPREPAERVIPADLHDDRVALAPAPRSAPLPGGAPARSTRSPLDAALAKAAPLAAQPKGSAAPKRPAADSIAVDVPRAGQQAPDLRPAGAVPNAADKAPTSIPIAAVERREIAPAATPPAGTLKRRQADGAIPVAGASIGPESLLAARRRENKQADVEKRGGSTATQEAVARGLTWLERHQFPDGHFSLHDFSQRCQDHQACTAEGNLACDAAATALALLPFLGDGHTQHEGKYPELVDRGIDWLVARQKRDGELTAGNEGKARMYGHGLAAIALCEAYAMSQDPRLREPAQRALDFIVASQHRASGGWRYQPNEPADTSVVGWQVMALKSGQMARLSVPQRSFDLARKWLDSVEGLGSQRGRFGYQSREPTPSMTAEGLLCRQYMGAGRDDPSLLAGAEYLLANLPHKDRENSYYWYYGTQTMYHLQGHYWEKWNAALRDYLVATQIKEGPMAGTWNPVDRGEVTGGRLFATSMRVLMLEVYYRHLPLYQALEE